MKIQFLLLLFVYTILVLKFQVIDASDDNKETIKTNNPQLSNEKDPLLLEIETLKKENTEKSAAEKKLYFGVENPLFDHIKPLTKYNEELQKDNAELEKENAELKDIIRQYENKFRPIKAADSSPVNRKFKKLKDHLYRNIFEYLDLFSMSTYTFMKVLEKFRAPKLNTIIFQFPVQFPILQPDHVPFQEYMTFLDIIYNPTYHPEEKYSLLHTVFTEKPDQLMITKMIELKLDESDYVISEIFPRDQNTAAAHDLKKLSLSFMPMIYNLLDKTLVEVDGTGTIVGRDSFPQMPWFFLFTFRNFQFAPEIKTINDVFVFHISHAKSYNMTRLELITEFQTYEIKMIFSANCKELILKKLYLSPTKLHRTFEYARFRKTNQSCQSSIWKYIASGYETVHQEYSDEQWKYYSESNFSRMDVDPVSKSWFKSIDALGNDFANIEAIYVDFFF